MMTIATVEKEKLDKKEKANRLPIRVSNSIIAKNRYYQNDLLHLGEERGHIRTSNRKSQPYT
jgi:hypothetical protein